MPMENTKEAAQQAIKRAKFPTTGKRGKAYYIRAAQYGKLNGID